MEPKQVLEKLQAYPFNRCEEIPVSVIRFTEEVRNLCAVNACGRYGSNWQCPPGVGELDELAQKCRSYPYAILFNTVTNLEDSFDFEGMNEAGNRHRKLCLQIRKELCEWLGKERFVLLGAGGCTICPKCTYLDNEPCRYPDKAIASMEASGIDVVSLCAETGIPYINGKDTVTYFGLLLFS